MNHSVRFFVKSILAGLLAALTILWFWPELMRTSSHAPSVTFASGTQVSNQSGPFSYSDAVVNAAPAVVNIYSEKIIQRRVNPLFEDPMFSRFFGKLTPKSQRPEIQTSLGSGVIISPEGYLLTNLHVIRGANEIHVSLADGRSTQAVVVGTDEETDLAVLRIPLKHLQAILLSTQRPLRVGDVALAIGNPFGVGQTVTLGIISATGRNHLGINTFENFIQTDAAINPGNSGGALVNPFGELIGINTAIFSKSGGSQGIGFAIPVDLAYDVFKQIIQYGRAVRGWLGVRALTLSPRKAEIMKVPNMKGAIIEGVLKGGPADLAGLLPDDIVTHINGEPTENTYDILIKVSNTKPGQKIKLTGFRKGNQFSVTATTIERPTQ